VNGRNGTTPRAVLLDFGGVLVDIVPRPWGTRDVAKDVHELLRREGAPLALDRVERDVRAGWKAYGDWKSAEGRRPHPREMRHRELWEELVAADWPAPSRAIVAERAGELCERLDVATKDRPPKPDALPTLRALAERGIACGVVSNALAGSGSRRLVRQHGFEPYLAAQVYSDETGVRKPNPDIFRIAAGQLGVDLADTWYVGDQIDRDVLGARRASVGRVLLLPSRATGTGNDALAQPDAVIERPGQILDLLPARAEIR
jgi:HAD superfamily hydrolase (TIGR01549 family)